MIKKLLIATSLILAGASCGWAQDVSARYQFQVIGSRGLPLANQNVAICTQPAVTTTQPCSPLATLATSTTTTSGGANPTTTDSNGNGFFYAAPGKYTVQVYGPQVSGQFVIPDTLVGASGPANITICKNFETIQCTDSTLPHGGTDIGNDLNLTYAAQVAPGQEIWQGCATNGSNLPFSTPVVFATVGQVSPIRSLGPTNHANNGCALNYTPTTATNAMRFDYGSSTLGTLFSPQGGLDRMTLINNGGASSANPGGGSLATGILLGATNGGGGHGFKLRDTKVGGFAVGVTHNATNGWGTMFDNLWCVYNAKCLTFGTTVENVHWFGGGCLVNNTCIDSTNNSGDIETAGWSCDAPVTTCYNGGGTFGNFFGHDENSGQTNINYNNGTGGVQTFWGGMGLNDTTSGSPIAGGMYNTASGFLGVYGKIIASSNQTITTLFNNTGTGVAHGYFYTYTPGQFTNICASIPQCLMTEITITGAAANPFHTFGTELRTGDDWEFQPTAATALGPVRYDVAGGGAFWATGTKNCTGTTTNDFVFCGTGSTGFGQHAAYRINATNGNIGMAPGAGNATFDTASPANGLDIQGSTADLTLNLQNTGTGGHQIRFDSTNNSSGFGGSKLVVQDVTAGTNVTLNTTVTGTYTVTIASGTAAMTTALIAAGACGTTVTASATNVLTTDTINDDFNTAVTAANNGLLIFHKWPTAGNVNFNYCNPGAAGVTPTAMTVNWQVTR